MDGWISLYLVQSVGGETYNLIKSMYTKSQCIINKKKQQKRTYFSGQWNECCSFSPTLFKMYINMYNQ